MPLVEAVLLEPVGCLAEFPAEPFIEIAARVFGRKKKPSVSGSRAYWHLLNLMEDSEAKLVEELEIEAAHNAIVYEDVAPALAELKVMGVTIAVTSSLSAAAVERLVEQNQLAQFFTAICSRDNSGGIKAAPLQRALAQTAIGPDRAVYLTDTAEGLKTAQSVNVHAVLMMNDPDEAKRLALREPAGGIVSLHELPDFIRLFRKPRA
jgi:phosphoglycolate phosphatase-like HAD superfamily hydrolase